MARFPFPTLLARLPPSRGRELPTGADRPLRRPWNPKQKHLRHVLRDLGTRALWLSGDERIRPQPGTLTVVTLHRFLPPAFRDLSPWPDIAVTPPTFARMLSVFGTHYRVLPVTEALAALNEGDTDRPLLSITVDDGQWDNWRYARPLLRKAGLRATFYIPTDAIDEQKLLWPDRLGFALGKARGEGLDVRPLAARAFVDERALDDADALVAEVKKLSDAQRAKVMELCDGWIGDTPYPDWSRLMTWEEIRDLHRDGHEIGGHSRTHPILPSLDDDALEDEIVGCKARLEEELEAAVHSFAYPNGDCDERVVNVTRAAGFSNAVTCVAHPVRAGDDAFTLGRYDLQEELNYGLLGQVDAPNLAFRLSPYRSAPTSTERS